MSFQVFKTNNDLVAATAQDEQDRKNSGNKFYFKTGSTVLRILPAYSALGQFWQVVNNHNISYDRKFNWICPAKTFSEPCQICEALSGLKAQGVDTSDYEANKRRAFLSALVLYTPEDEKARKSDLNWNTDIKLVDCPMTVYNWIINTVSNPLLGDVTDIVNGWNILIQKSGEGKSTKYTTTTYQSRGPIPQQILSQMPQALPDLEKIVKKSARFGTDTLRGLLSEIGASAQNLTPAMANAPVAGAGLAPQGGGLSMPSPVAAPAVGLGLNLSQPPATAPAIAATPAPAPTPAPVGKVWSIAINDMPKHGVSEAECRALITDNEASWGAIKVWTNGWKDWLNWQEVADFKDIGNTVATPPLAFPAPPAPAPAVAAPAVAPTPTPTPTPPQAPLTEAVGAAPFAQPNLIQPTPPVAIGEGTASSPVSIEAAPKVASPGAKTPQGVDIPADMPQCYGNFTPQKVMCQTCHAIGNCEKLTCGN